MPVLFPLGEASNETLIVFELQDSTNATRVDNPYPEEPPIIKTFLGPLNFSSSLASLKSKSIYFSEPFG